jgi:RimJ/RimL family protein N-acetyltransferase
MPVLETPRLLIRELSTADAPFIIALVNDPAFVRFIGDRGVRTRADAERYILDGPVASYRDYGFGPYAVVLKASGRAIGICGLLKRDFLQDVDLGFAFLPAFRSRGFAFESAAAVLDDAARSRGIGRVLAITSPDNQASIALLLRLGFVHEHEVRPAANEPAVRLFARASHAPAAAQWTCRSQSDLPPE